jgi:hypothetical protein
MSEIDEMAELARFRATAAEPADDVLARVRTRLVAAVEGHPAQAEPLTAARDPRRRLGRRVAAVAGLAAVLTAAVVAVDTVTHDGRPLTGASASAAEKLNAAADRALRARDPVVRPGQYLYTRTVEETTVTVLGDGRTGTVTYMHRNLYEVWRPADWNGEWMLRRTDDAESHVLRPGDGKKLPGGRLPAPTTTVLRAPGGDFHHSGGSRTGSWQEPTPEFMAGLPRDPRQLLKRVYADSKDQGNDPQTEAFVYVTDILRSGVVPADLRAALFRAAALIPGMQVVDDAVNLDGRQGVAVARTGHAGIRTELVFDPGTGQVIGERQVATRPLSDLRIPAGTPVEYTAVTSAVVDRMGQTPAR